MPIETQQFLAGKWVADKSLGYVLFATTQLDAGTVTHEAVHMATSFLRRVRQSLRLHSQIDDTEETLAYAVGRMATKVNHELYKRGCYR